MPDPSSPRCGTLALTACLLLASQARAAGEISQLITIDQPATPFQYSVGGQSYDWGIGRNQLIDRFSVAGQSYGWAISADRVVVVRRDVAGLTTGEPCGVFVETEAGSLNRYQANYPIDPGSNEKCDLAGLLASRIVNRGVLNVFNNAEPLPQNIERLDYLFDRGVLAPLDASRLDQAGHLVAEKSGNNALRVAAILALDEAGQPARYGDLVTVNPVDSICTGMEVCYGLTDLQHSYAWLQSESLAPQRFPMLIDESAEPVAMAFVSAAALGLQPGQRYFGYSFFADDVNAQEHDLLDVSTFPADTQDAYILPGDDADIYGGVSGYFVAAGSNSAGGAVFVDENGDGQRDDSEAGIGGVPLALYTDTDSNGVLDPDSDTLLTALQSAANGNFTLPVLPDGSYFLALDAAAGAIPAGLVLPEGSNPLAFVVSGSSPDNLDFAFVSETGGNPGGAGTTTGGASGGGGTDAGTGATTAGPGQPGGSSTDGDTDGGSGTTTAGPEQPGGSSTDGATDSGSGTTTAGPEQPGGGTDGDTDSGAGTGGIDDDGQSSLAANRDVVEIRQGTPTLIDVLANDIDPSGAGLTLVSVETPVNGTAAIVDGQVLYTPDYGFTGDDPFIYTISGSAGADGTGLAEASGTVSVTVIRYSDINADGINDFDQCGGCESLSLETGLDGTGVGRMPSAVLWLLLGLAGCRRWRSRRSLPVEGRR